MTAALPRGRLDWTGLSDIGLAPCTIVNERKELLDTRGFFLIPHGESEVTRVILGLRDTKCDTGRRGRRHG
jgi:hypothetical protein